MRVVRRPCAELVQIAAEPVRPAAEPARPMASRVRARCSPAACLVSVVIPVALCDACSRLQPAVRGDGLTVIQCEHALGVTCAWPLRDLSMTFARGQREVTLL